MRLVRERPAATLAAAELAAFWPVYPYYAARVVDKADDPWPLVALITAVVLSLPGIARRTPLTAKHLATPTALIVLYAAAYAWVPPLVRTLFALAALASTLCLSQEVRTSRAPLFGLFLLGAPVLSTLAFTGGYPLRWLTGQVSAALLRSCGLDVVGNGSNLEHAERIVVIDAPCSGVRMLWVGLYVTLAAAHLMRLDTLRTLLALFVAVGVVILTNALRCASLFLLEASELAVPAWTHAATGLAAFLPALLAIAVCVRWLKPEARCAT
jgi:exosortase/archaeosortase family protein